MNDSQERIREQRRTLSGSIAYTSGCGEEGNATWLNISRTGAAIVLGRYLRPGRTICLELEEGGKHDVAIPAEIAWCVPVPGTCHFKTGLRINRHNPEIALKFATLGYGAPKPNKNTFTTVSTAAWSSHNTTIAPLPNADVTNLTQAV